MYFIENEIQTFQDLDFHRLKFCPTVHNNGLVLSTLSKDRKQVKVNKLFMIIKNMCLLLEELKYYNYIDLENKWK